MSKRKDGRAIGHIRDAASQAGINIEYLSKHVMNTLADQRAHQGVMADCNALPYAPVHTWPAADDAHAVSDSSDADEEQRPAASNRTLMPLCLALDQVVDPVRLTRCS